MGLPVLGRMEDAADTYAALRLIRSGSNFSHRVLTEAAEGWFKSVDEVPKSAITVTISALFRVPKLVLSVVGARKANIVGRTFDDPIATACPSTILRTHPDGRDAAVVAVPDTTWGHVLEARVVAGRLLGWPSHPTTGAWRSWPMTAWTRVPPRRSQPT